MKAPTTDIRTEATALSQDDTRAALLAAIAGNAKIDLRCADDLSGTCVKGEIVGADASFLLVGLQAIDVRTRSKLTASKVIVEIHSGKSLHVFETSDVHATVDQQRTVIRIHMPKTVRLCERRLTHRRRFKPTKPLTLRGSTAAKNWTSEAVMLNVSAGGLACRTSTAVIKELGMKGRLRVVFELEGAGEFDLTARVVSITEGGTAKQWILGLEFVADEDLAGCLDRLVSATSALG